jgi:hypothetical protein
VGSPKKWSLREVVIQKFEKKFEKNSHKKKIPTEYDQFFLTTFFSIFVAWVSWFVLTGPSSMQGQDSETPLFYKL